LQCFRAFENRQRIKPRDPFWTNKIFLGVLPVMATILQIREEAATTYENDEELHNKIIYELGANIPLINNCYKV